MSVVEFFDQRLGPLPKIFQEGPQGFVLGGGPLRGDLVMDEYAVPVLETGRDGKERDMSGRSTKEKPVKRTHRHSKASRRAAYASDVIKPKLNLKPLTLPQIKWLSTEARKAWEYQRKNVYDERSFDQFRAEEVSVATATHEAGHVRGLSEKSGGKQAHFNCLIAAFLLLQNRSGEALDWIAKDSDEARRLNLVRHLIRELLKKLPLKPGMEEGSIEGSAYREGWGTTFAMHLYKLPVERLNADQADYCYRRMLGALPKEEMQRRADAWIEAQKTKERAAHPLKGIMVTGDESMSPATVAAVEAIINDKGGRVS